MKIEVIWDENRIKVGIDGKWQSFRKWCLELGVAYYKAKNRLYMGWPMEEALGLVPHVALSKKKKKHVRLVSSAEKRQRGCVYCLDNVRDENTKGIHVGRYCPYAECPYRELDKHETYEQYIRSTDLSGFAKALAGLGLTVEEEE